MLLTLYIFKQNLLFEQQQKTILSNLRMHRSSAPASSRFRSGMSRSNHVGLRPAEALPAHTVSPLTHMGTCRHAGTHALSFTRDLYTE